MIYYLPSCCRVRSLWGERVAIGKKRCWTSLLVRSVADGDTRWPIQKYKLCLDGQWKTRVVVTLVGLGQSAAEWKVDELSKGSKLPLEIDLELILVCIMEMDHPLTAFHHC